MNWKDVLKNIAPSLAMALPPPFSVIAATALKEALNLDKNAKEEDINNAVVNASPETILKIKQCEQQFLAEMKKIDADLETIAQQEATKRDQIAAEDRDSARGLAKSGDKTARNLAYVITFSGIAMIGLTLGGMSQVDSVLAGTLIGYVISEMKQVTTFYFGSSSGSAAKTELLARAQPIKPN